MGISFLQEFIFGDLAGFSLIEKNLFHGFKFFRNAFFNTKLETDYNHLFKVDKQPKYPPNIYNLKATNPQNKLLEIPKILICEDIFSHKLIPLR